MSTSASQPSLPLFYVQPKVLQPGLHGQKSISKASTYKFAAETNAAPLVAAEIPLAGRQFPIVFSEDPNPHPVVVLGLRDQQNVFVDAEGQWREGAYVPAYIRRYPFIFLENEARTELTLCVDEAHLVDGRENPLFEEDGKPTALTQAALAFCRDYQAQHLAAAEFAAALAEAGLLVDNRADITLNDGQKMSLSGFKVIDEARFHALPADVLVRWRDKGWLPLVYAHFFSLGSWSSLVDRTALAAPAAPAA
jgi:hypothetical protein